MDQKKKDRMYIAFSVIVVVFMLIVIIPTILSVKRDKKLLSKEGIIDTCYVYDIDYIPKKGKSIKCLFYVGNQKYKAQYIDLDYFEHEQGVNIMKGDTFLVSATKKTHHFKI